MAVAIESKIHSVGLCDFTPEKNLRDLEPVVSPRLNCAEMRDDALLTFVSRFADVRQQICRPSSADLPTFVSRFADLRQQILKALFGTID